MFKKYLTLLLLGAGICLASSQPAAAKSKLNPPYCNIPEIKSPPLTRDLERQLKDYIRSAKGDGFRLYNASNTIVYVEVNGTTYGLSPRKERYILGQGRRVTIRHPRSFNDPEDRSRRFRIHPGTGQGLWHVLYRADDDSVGTCLTVRRT